MTRIAHDDKREKAIVLRAALPGVIAAERYGVKIGDKRIENAAYRLRIEMAAEYALLEGINA